MTGDLAAISDLLEQVRLSLDRLNGQTSSDSLRVSGFYTGIYEGELAKLFFKRLESDSEGKQCLSDFLLREWDRGDKEFIEGISWNPIKKMFCESGTTFAKLISDFTRPENRSKLPRECHTNNLLVETAWVNIVKDVFVEPGRFIAKYYGLFPFADTANEADVEYEAWGYDGVSRSVASSDVVLATCSRFSFVAGPVVGSRANAIFKNAMFSKASEKKTFVLMLDFSKIIAFSAAPDGLTFKKPKDCICELPRSGHEYPEVPAISPWHKQWHDKKVPQADELVTGYRLKARSWIDVLPDIKILIALPEQKWKLAYDFLKEEVAAAQRYLNDEYKHLVLELSDEPSAKKWKVAQVRAYM
jgi:hypothetical protein